MAQRPKAGTKAGSDATQPPPAPTRADGKPFKIKLAEHKKRADRAWSDNEPFQKILDDAYDFAIPHRRPAARIGKGQQRIERLFDSTAVDSVFRAAGQLHQDLFPPAFWKLALGSVTKAAIKLQKMSQDEADQLETQLEVVTDIAMAFFQSGEFDTASHETCLDLMAGTGALFPLEGDDDEPVRWMCIPFDELAVECDAYGKVVGIYWRQKLTVRQIFDAFPEGVFPASFTGKHNEAPDEEIELRQDFVRDPKTKRWIFCAYLADSEAAIAEDEYMSQPIAVGRYHRVPGEARGRGPITLALPTIKTLNKATELQLKSAAINMLGIWGYRPGGAFNPETVRLGPGEFWPMQATGGVLGPDVTRLDPATGKIDVGNLISQELRLQVKSMLGDNRLPERGATPPSAAEIMARMKQISQNYLGAYGRLVNELHPVIVRRVIEILYRRRIIDQNVNIDTLLVKVEVMSPIASAVKASAHARFIDFVQLVVALKGTPLAADLLVKVDEGLRQIGSELLPKSLLRTATEQADIERLIQAAAAQLVGAQQQTPAQGAA